MTTKPWKGKGKLRKRQALLNARRNAHSLTVRSVKDPNSYRTPGSMKGRS